MTFLVGGGGFSFYMENKVKFEIFDDIKFINKDVFLCHNQDIKLRNFNYKLS